MSKRYKLLDTVHSPNFIANRGDIGILKDNGKVWFDNDRYYYNLTTIENNPSWFEAEHQCKHCGATTFQADEECWNYQSNKVEEPSNKQEPKKETPFEVTLADADWEDIRKTIKDKAYPTMWLVNQINVILRDKQSKQPSNTADSKERVPICFSKDASDFIQMTFNFAAEGWYWTEFVYEQTGTNVYKLWSVNDLHTRLKNLINPKLYSQGQMDKAVKDAFVAAKEKCAPSYVSGKQFDKYPTLQDYKNSLK